MFGKRSTSGPDSAVKAPDTPVQRVAAPPLQPAAPEPAPAPAPTGASVVEGGRSPIPSVGLGAPLVAAPTAGRQSSGMPPERPLAPTATDSRHTDAYYETKGTIFGALIEAIDLAQLAKLDAEFGARGNPRHRQRDHRDQEHRDVDLRAGRAARRHLQRRARLWPARAAARARRHRRHHGERLRHRLHRGRRQDPAHRHPLSRQPAADEHLPAHRQPDRPPRRRILADLRRAPAGRLARQRHRRRRWRSTAPRSPSGSSRRTSSRSSSWSSSARSRPRAPRS